jgi:hypothetical protein
MDEAIDGPVPAPVTAPVVATPEPKELRFAEGGMVPSVPYEQSQQYLDGVKRAEADKAKLAAIEAAKNPAPVAPVAAAPVPSNAATQLASVPSATSQPALAKLMVAPSIQKPAISSAPTPTNYAGVIRNGNSFSDSASSNSPSMVMQSSAQNTSTIDGVYRKKRQYNTGGHINGPGTATSDSIPILASKGEFIINAAAAKKIGKSTLNALNNIASATDKKKIQGHFAVGSDDVLNDKDALVQVETTKPKLNLPSGITQNGNTFTQSPVAPAATQGRDILRPVATAQQQMSQVETVRPNQPVQVETRPMAKPSGLPAGITQVNANTFEQSTPDNPGRKISRPAPIPSEPMQQVNTTPPPAPEASPRFQNAGTAASDAKMAATRAANAARVEPPVTSVPAASQVNPSRLTGNKVLDFDVNRLVPKVAISKLATVAGDVSKFAGKVATPLAMMGTAAQSFGTDTDEYSRRTGIEGGSLGGDLAARAVGTMADLGNNITFGVADRVGNLITGNGFNRSDDGSAKPAVPQAPVVKPQAAVAAVAPAAPATAPIVEPSAQELSNAKMGLAVEDQRGAIPANSLTAADASFKSFQGPNQRDPTYRLANYDSTAPIYAQASPGSKRLNSFTGTGNPVEGGPTQDELVATKIAAMNRTGDLQRQVNEAQRNLNDRAYNTPGVSTIQSADGMTMEQSLRANHNAAMRDTAIQNLLRSPDRNKLAAGVQLAQAEGQNRIGMANVAAHDRATQAATLSGQRLAQLQSADSRYGTDSLAKSHADANKTAQARLANDQAGTQIDIKGKQSLMDLQNKFINAKPEDRDTAEENFKVASGKSDKVVPDLFGTIQVGADPITGVPILKTFDKRSGKIVEQNSEPPLPPGMVKYLGTSNGKKVYQDKSGNQVIAKG